MRHIFWRIWNDGLFGFIYFLSSIWLWSQTVTMHIFWRFHYENTRPVSSFSLHTTNILNMQYKESYEQNFDTLIQQSVKSSTQFKYWYLGLELIFKFLIFNTLFKMLILIFILMHYVMVKNDFFLLADLWNFHVCAFSWYLESQSGIWTCLSITAKRWSFHFRQIKKDCRTI